MNARKDTTKPYLQEQNQKELASIMFRNELLALNQ